ncbi:MAG TPA: ribonuclease J [Bacilli bacterium]|nr:ribonuclease J [Bacilli bacterium]
MANALLSSPVSVYALGGLGEVGKNTYCIENDKTLIMIDAGVRFPEEDLPGVDYVIPDYTHIKNNRSKFKALIITHGHEDHIGGIPFLVQHVFVPVIYAPRLAAAFIRHKLEDNRIKENVKIVEYSEESEIKIDDFRIQFFHMTHSIPDAYGICVDTPEGRIVTTGDFKIDLTPIGEDINLGKIARLGTEGIDLLLSDSTNAEIEGYTPSERNIIGAINDIFKNASGRLIISTFSSNISRIQQIVEVAVNYRKKIVVIGRSMENAVMLSRKMGIIKIPDSSLVPIEDIRSLRAEETVVLCTGSQGEPMAALSRIANGEHRQLRIIPGDTVVFSSSPIPGNGLSINKVVNQLTRAGATVLTNSVLYNVHSSGHPARQELRIMLKLFRPRYFMPVHGEYRMLKLHAELAHTLGMSPDHTFICGNGDTLVLRKGVVSRGPHVPAEALYIDGRDINGLSTAVIRDRKILAEDGMVSVIVAIDSQRNQLLLAPKITTAGFVYQASGNLIAHAEIKVKESLDELMKNRVNFNEIKQAIRSTVGKYLFIKTQRNPMIIPVIMNKTGA